MTELLTTRNVAAYRYRAEIKRAIAAYYDAARIVWLHYGRPASSAECQRDLNLVWGGFVAKLGHLSRQYETAARSGEYRNG